MPRRAHCSAVLLLAVFFSGLLASGAQSGTPTGHATATTGDIAGTITNHAGKAMANALVAIQSGPMLLSAYTNSKGTYDLSGLLPGQYSVSVSKPGFNSVFEPTVSVIVKEVTALNAALIWSDPSTGGIETDVTDATSGQPLPGATVNLLHIGAVIAQGATNSIGSAILIGIAHGNYRVEVQRTGYDDSDEVAVTVSNDALTTVAVKLKRDASQAGELTGVVTDINGGVVEGATVEIVAGPTTGSTTSDSTGTFLFSDLSPDDGYSLQITATGYEQQTVPDISVQAQTTTTRDVALIPGSTTAGSIAGVVTDTSGNLLAAATVSITAGPGLGLSTTTNSNGSYTLSNLPAGTTYAVQAQEAGYLPAGASPITVTVGQTTLVNLALTLTGTATGAIAGTVLDANSLPLQGVVVTILTGPSSGLTATTEGTGNYEIDQLIPGSNYSLSFVAAGYTASSVTGILVQSSLTTTVDNQLIVQQAPTGTIAGTVKKSSGGALAGATVTVFTGPSSPVSTTTASNGTYSIPNLQAAGGYGIQVTDTGWETGEVTAISVQAATTTTVNFSLVQTVKPGNLKGTVFSLLSQSIAGATVQVLDGPTLPSSTQTDSSGDFSFTGLMPGSYTVEASANGFQSRTQANISVSSSETANVSFTLLGAGQGAVGAISGKVTKSTGGAFSGATVSLIAGPTSPLTVSTSSTGTYAFSNLQAGFGYQVQVSAPGYQKVTLTAITVTNGQVTAVNATLKANSKATGISGQVLDLFSNPVVGATVQILAGPDIPANVLTDSNGNFAFTGLSAGTYTVQVTANGFQSSLQDNIDVSAGESTAVDFILQDAF